jgi:hypothetical protein
MTHIIDTTSKHRLSAKLAGGIAIATVLVLGSFVGSANADGRGDHRGNWGGGYYAAPPVVYGSAYGNGYYGSPYYAPPVVYGPGVGIDVGGIGIGIR